MVANSRTTTRIDAGHRVIAKQGGSQNQYRYAYYVWGLQYIDELIQINVADDPSGAGGGGASFVHQGVLHDPQYSALRLVAWDEDAADYHEPTAGALSPGDTVERYDYSPYGRRRVFGLTDALDVHGFHPLAQSQPMADPFGAVHHCANDVGFQGLGRVMC